MSNKSKCYKVITREIFICIKNNVLNAKSAMVNSVTFVCVSFEHLKQHFFSFFKKTKKVNLV